MNIIPTGQIFFSLLDNFLGIFPQPLRRHLGKLILVKQILHQLLIDKIEMSILTLLLSSLKPL